MKVTDYHKPFKQKKERGNQTSFKMAKELSKVMK